MWSQGGTQDPIECIVVGAASLAAPCLFQDVAQEVASWLRFGHGLPGCPFRFH